jgi:hypothetical protein
MNCGMAGSDPFFEYVLLRDKLLKYKPDVVVVMINESDINDVVSWGGFDRFRPDGLVGRRSGGPWWEFIYADSYLFRLFIKKAFVLDDMFYTTGQRAELRSMAIKELNLCMDSLQVLCTANNIYCFFAFNPFRNDFQNGLGETKQIIESASAKGYKTIDLLPYFRPKGVNEQNSSEYFGAVDGHCNNKGYQMVAKGIRQAINESPH